MLLLDLDMVTVPEGVFLMGWDPQFDAGIKERELPIRKIWLSAFKIQKTPVTVKQWQIFLQETNYNWSFKENILSDLSEELFSITNVTWLDCYAFVEWLRQISGFSYDLPTEAQWEKACRGENGQLYPWGNYELDDDEEATLMSKVPVCVGSHPRLQSPYGCLDMWVNVSEWCSDWFEEFLYEYKDEGYPNNPSITVNPRGAEKGKYKVWRGGCFWSAGWARASYRGFTGPDSQNELLGFRVVLNLA